MLRASLSWYINRDFIFQLIVKVLNSYPMPWGDSFKARSIILPFPSPHSRHISPFDRGILFHYLSGNLKNLSEHRTRDHNYGLIWTARNKITLVWYCKIPRERGMDRMGKCSQGYNHDRRGKASRAEQKWPSRAPLTIYIRMCEWSPHPWMDSHGTTILEIHKNKVSFISFYHFSSNNNSK